MGTSKTKTLEEASNPDSKTDSEEALNSIRIDQEAEADPEVTKEGVTNITKEVTKEGT